MAFEFDYRQTRLCAMLRGVCEQSIHAVMLQTAQRHIAVEVAG